MTPTARADALAAQTEADPRFRWTRWTVDSSDELARLVERFEPLDKRAGHDAADWLKSKARADIFTVTELLVSDNRVEGFISCRVSEATLTWSGIESLGASREEARKRVPAYLLCWCAKHRECEIDGDELVLNAIRLAREVKRYGCVVLALDPHDDECAEKVWIEKHGFREGAVPRESGSDYSQHTGERRLWTPLDTA